MSLNSILGIGFGDSVRVGLGLLSFSAIRLLYHGLHSNTTEPSRDMEWALLPNYWHYDKWREY
jgi:hypothetical protein